jgi:hypothetical protein
MVVKEMMKMFAINATTARNEWSSVIESVVRERPAFIKRTRDHIFMSDFSVMKSLLAAYSFHAEILTEDDGTITLALDEIDLVENAIDLQNAISLLASAILEYATDYYNDFIFWSRGERKKHIPFVFKALILNDIEEIGGLIKCRHGKI